MIRTRRRAGVLTSLALVAIAGFAVIAGACGDDDDDPDGDATPQATSDSAATSPAAATTDDAAETPDAGDETPATGDGDTTIAVGDGGDLGPILVDADGLTLYTFENDVADSGESACVEGCATAWPAATVEGEPTAGSGAAGELATIERADGTTQVTYDGAPLYRFSGDTAPGDTNGQAVADIWFVAQP